MCVLAHLDLITVYFADAGIFLFRSLQQSVKCRAGAVASRALFNPRRRLVSEGACAPTDAWYILAECVKCPVGEGHLRSSTFAFLAKALNDAQHFLPAAVTIDHFACHAH